MKRQVVIKNTTSNNKETHMVEASTYGELQSELGVNYSDNKVIVRETRQTLELKDAALPEGSFHLYVMPLKTKAGSYTFPATTNWDDLGHNDLRAACKERGLPAVHIPSADMREALVSFQEETSVDVENVLANVASAVEILKNCYTEIQNLDVGGSLGISIEELDRDVKQIQSELN